MSNMQIKDIKNCRYRLSDGKFSFDSNVGNIEMNAADALEIAYTLFDYAGMSYEKLDEISEIVEG